MGKTAAERKRVQRERQKKEDYAEFRKKENERQQMWRNKRRAEMNKSIAKREEQKKKRCKEQQRYRAKCKEKLKKASVMPDSPSKAFKSNSSFGKAMAKVKRNLPNSPRKRKALVKKLAIQFSPHILKTVPKKRPNTAISPEVKDFVILYYEQDDVSYSCPGMRDFIIIREEGKKMKVQKRYLFLTLGETYQIFRETHPDVGEKIRLSKFCSLRPQHICLRADTPNNLCLCVHHENVRLALDSLTPIFPRSTSEFVNKIVCDEGNEDCMMQTCPVCKDSVLFKEIVKTVDEEALAEDITYKEWVKDEAGRLTRMTSCLTKEEVVIKLEEKLPAFLSHVYVK